MADVPLIPELTRSLRTLGLSGDVHRRRAHDAVLAPLLQARAAAAAATSRREAAHAFRGPALRAEIRDRVRAAASSEMADAAQARARCAAALDAVAPLLDASAALDDEDARVEDDLRWQDFLDAVRRLFATADDAVDEVARILAVPPPPPRTPRLADRWRAAARPRHGDG